MRGTKVKRLRKLGLKSGPKERAELTAGEAAPIRARMELAKTWRRSTAKQRRAMGAA